MSLLIVTTLVMSRVMADRIVITMSNAAIARITGALLKGVSCSRGRIIVATEECGRDTRLWWHEQREWWMFS